MLLNRARGRRASRTAAFLALTATALVARPALAASPTVDQCINANEAAQSLRASGELRDAEAKLTFCTASACPGPVRADCAERLNEVERVMPTIVFDVRTTAGAPLTAVEVTMDGALLASSLDGRAIAVDPGNHRFEITAEGLAPAAESLLVLEGVKARVERIVLAPAAPPAAAVSGHEGMPPARVGAVVALGVGVAGLALGTVFGAVAIAHKTSLDHDCTAGACPPSEQGDISGLHTNAVAANVALGVGVAGVAVAAILYFAVPPRRARVGAGAVRFGFDGGGLSGTFE